MPLRLELVVADGIGGAQLVAARRCLERLGRYSDEPLDLTATMRRAHGGRGNRPYHVDARLVYRGRVLAAHVSARGLSLAADEAALQLRRQLRRIVGTDVALRNDPRTLQRALTERPAEDFPPAGPKPPEDRRLVSRRTYADHPESTYEAISDLIDDDERFHLFVHVRTSEDVVVHRRDHDPRIGLLHPRGSVLSDETDDVVLASPSRYGDPLTLAQVREEMDLAEHRFVYFIDAGDTRGKVLYRRRDGDYGLVEPG
jgi:ribosome-associated translation inhibitor RaiA